MRFSTRIFIALVGLSILISSSIIWSAHQYIKTSKVDSFTTNYEVLINVLGDTLVQMEKNTEILMKNAAMVVGEVQGSGEPLDTETLSKLRSQTNVTHVFMIDNTGRFIRSTNESPKLIPNLFSFCDDYRKLIDGRSLIETTPIIPPQPELLPYKFMSIPTKDRKHIIEVGIRADFIGETLTRALQKDSNVLELSVYAPDGTSLGNFGRDAKEYSRTIKMPSTSLSDAQDSKSELTISGIVESSQTKCCQCDKSGLSKNGKYYYVLRARISKAHLMASLNQQLMLFSMMQIAAIIFSVGIASYLGRRIGRRFETVNKKISAIVASQDFSKRVNLDGNDEMANLSKNFDHLLSLSQIAAENEIANKQSQAMMKVARHVAHDIRSPMSALLMAADTIPTKPAEATSLIKMAAERINRIAQDLLNNPAAGSADAIDLGKGANLTDTLKQIVAEKRAEFASHNDVVIREIIDENKKAILLTKDLDIKRVISNLINNSVEASVGRNLIQISTVVSHNQTQILVSDQGAGIPEDILASLNGDSATTSVTTKENGHGLGLSAAREAIRNAGGTIAIRSKLGAGTIIDIKLPSQQVAG